MEVEAYAGDGDVFPVPMVIEIQGTTDESDEVYGLHGGFWLHEAVGFRVSQAVESLAHLLRIPKIQILADLRKLLSILPRDHCEGIVEKMKPVCYQSTLVEHLYSEGSNSCNFRQSGGRTAVLYIAFPVALPLAEHTRIILGVACKPPGEPPGRHKVQSQARGICLLCQEK